MADSAPSSSSRLSPQEAEARSRFLLAHFFQRLDYVNFMAWWGKPSPTRVRHPEIEGLAEVVRAHVDRDAPAAFVSVARGTEVTDRKGHWRIGSFTPSLDNLTKWAAVDVDGKGHANAVADPLAAAQTILANARRLGLGEATVLERSGGGTGWHVWILFDELVPAVEARRLAVALCPGDVLLARPTPTGEIVANARKNIGLEAYPKTEAHRGPHGMGLGNAIWLPWWHGAPEGCCVFCDDSGRPLVGPDGTNVPRVVPVSASALASMRTTVGNMTKDRDVARSYSDVQELREWLRHALARVDPHWAYGDLLTGKTSADGSWYEARDPDSSSGDVHPSAAVSTGSAGEAMRFYSHLTPEGPRGIGIRFTDWLIKQGRANSFTDALRLISEHVGMPMPIKKKVLHDGKVRDFDKIKPREIAHEGVIEVEERVTGSSSEDLIQEAPAVEPLPPEELPTNRLATILVGEQSFDDIVDESLRVFVRWNIFKGKPEMVAVDGKVCRVEEGKNDVEVVEATTEEMMVCMARSANYVAAGTGGRPRRTHPPTDVARAVQQFAPKHIPQVSRFSDAPQMVMERDGTRRWITQAGLDVKTGIWLTDLGACDPIPEKPTADEVAHSKAMLEELLEQFPFVTKADLTHAIAAIVTPLVRSYFRGPVPMIVVQAPTRGTGKTLLCQTIAAAVCGRPPQVQPVSSDEDEVRKKVLSELRRRKAYVIFDNFPERNRIASGVLAEILTADVHSDRILGRSEMISFEVRSVFFATANNPTFTEELERRAIRIHLNAKMERPEMRSGFKLPLPFWAIDHHRELVRAAAILVQAWDGTPWKERTIGSFEGWCQTVGGIMENAGYRDFVHQVDVGSVSESVDYSDLFDAMERDPTVRDGASAMTIADLCERSQLLPEIRGHDARSRAQSVGFILRSLVDRVFGNRVLIRVDGGNHRNHYKVVRLDP